MGSLLKEIVYRKGKVNIDFSTIQPYKIQSDTLRNLIEKAKNTEFGKAYNFQLIINSSDPVITFQKNVKIYNYHSILDEWWHFVLSGKENVCWPGKTKYFGLTSGTSDASSKKIPVTADMIKAIKLIGIRQLYSLFQYDLPRNFFDKKILMLGGSTSITPVNGHYEGDLSGIMSGNFPGWFNPFYKPGSHIAKIPEWDKKLEKIVIHAKKWDVSCIAGVPAWVQILMENIIQHYRINTIHDIWPNLRFYAHGGVSFKPYEKSFKSLIGKPIHYLETYLASEGFIAYQNGMDEAMDLVVDNGIFYEFIPFNSENFTAEGELKENPQTLLLNEVNSDTEYALLLSNCAGAWRYLIGDTIKFVSLKPAKIVITGRTKHFMSLCGEHLSIENMDDAIQIVANTFHININEYTVVGEKFKTLFAHRWYMGTDRLDLPVDKISKLLDNTLKELNDDYATERKAALRKIYVQILPTELFYDWMKHKGKAGGQNKFPRVLKNELLDDWEKYIEKKGYKNDRNNT